VDEPEVATMGRWRDPSHLPAAAAVIPVVADAHPGTTEMTGRSTAHIYTAGVVNSPSVADPFGKLCSGNDVDAKSAELADEFVWSGVCEDITVRQRNSFWWIPSATYLKYRDKAGPGRYGKRDTPPQKKELVRLETLHLVRVAKFLVKICALGLPWIVAAAAPDSGVATPFDLDAWSTVSANPEVRNFVAASPSLRQLDVNKSVLFWTFRVPHHQTSGDPMPSLLDLLAQSARGCKRHATDTVAELSHEPATGKRAGFWGNVLLCSGAAQLGDDTRASTAGCRSTRPAPYHAKDGTHTSDSTADELLHGPPGLVRSHWLRQEGVQDIRAVEESQAIGGMKRPSKAVDRLPSITCIGGHIYDKISEYLDNNFDAVGDVHEIVSGHLDREPSDTHVLNIRRLLSDCVGATDTEPVNNETYQTSVRAGILQAWRRAAEDPDDQPEQWLRHGAPAGIRLTPRDRGIFPTVSDQMDDPELLGTLADEVSGRRAMDEMQIALEKFQEYKDKNYVKEFGTYEELVDFLDGETPVISDVHVITKVRAGRTKHRIILNCRKAGLTRSSQRAERSILPRVTDAVADVMGLSLNESLGALLIQLGVLDFADAFWLIPLHRRERRYFTTKIGDKFFAFLRTAQGSRGAPLTWSRFGALLARLIQGVLGTMRARVNLYVDDTFLAFCNTLQGCKRDFALVIYVWIALGLPLTLKKADFGARITWTSAVFAVTTTKLHGHSRVRLVVQVKPDTVEEVTTLTKEYRKTNVISTKDLRSYAGKCTAIASVIFTWNPFLRPLWAALQPEVEAASRAPRGCTWTKQIKDSLDWIILFLESEDRLIRREYESDAFYGRGQRVEIDMDASPWGLGAILRIDGGFVEYFSDAISADDEWRFGHAIGDSKGQQTWECLVTLVALRLWMPAYRNVRICLRVRSDSTTALQLLLTLKCSGRGPTAIGRELALDLALGAYRPDVATHLPGVANAGPDVLSRLMSPDATKVFPQYLHGVHRAYPPPRNEVYYRTACNPITVVASQRAGVMDDRRPALASALPAPTVVSKPGVDVFQ